MTEEINPCPACGALPCDQVNNPEDVVGKLKSALKGLVDMYASTWDLADGGLSMLGSGVARFEAAHKAGREALGIFLIETED